MSRLCRVAMILTLLVLAGPLRGDELTIQPSFGWAGYYRPDSWVPVELTLANRTDKPLGGQVRLTAAQDELTEMTVVADWALAGRQSLDYRLVSKFARWLDKVAVTLTDDEGKRLHRQTFRDVGTTGSSHLKLLAPDEGLIGYAGRRTAGLGQMSRHVRRGNGTTGLYAAGKLAGRLPVDWAGYEALDALVLVNLDWSRVHPASIAAIGRWVRSGGKLLIAGEEPIDQTHPAADLVPVSFTGPVQADVLTRVPAADVPEATNLESVSLPVLKLDGPLPPGWSARTGTLRADRLAPAGGAEAVHWVGPMGLGRVAVVGLDPSNLPPADGIEADSVSLQAAIWANLLSELNVDAAWNPQWPEMPDRSMVHLGHAHEAAEATNAVLDYLMMIPELRPLSIWAVVGLLLGMAVVIGPVNYLVLRRLDKLPWTWLTTGVLIAGFSVGAYYAVRWFRAGEGQVRVVTVTDAVAGEPDAWHNRYTGVFAPVSDDYRARDVAGTDWWSAMAPSPDEYHRHFGRDLPTRRIVCRLDGDGCVPLSMPVNIWSMQVFRSEGPDRPPIAATVRRDGETARATIANRAEVPIERGRVIWPDGATLEFGPVPAGQQREVGGRLRDPGGPWRYGRHTVVTDEAIFRSIGNVRRTRAIRAQRPGGVLVVVEFDCDGAPRAGLGFAVGRRTAGYHQIWLARLVVPAGEPRGQQEQQE
jgi:hypothetical protein